MLLGEPPRDSDRALCEFTGRGGLHPGRYRVHPRTSATSCRICRRPCCWCRRTPSTPVARCPASTAYRSCPWNKVHDLALPHLPAYVPGPAPEHRPTADSAALVVYTSGTSGHPKGVTLSHGALFFNGVNTLLGLDIVADDVTLVNTPLSHVAALNTLAVATLYKGGTVILDSKFDAGRCLRQIEQFAVTTMFAVPSMLTLMAQVPGFPDANTASLRWILGGGAPMPPELVALWASRGVPVLASYGLTEAGPSVSFRRATDAALKSASSGLRRC
ncbi:long-chain fatty acid--CoA ligase [Rhodococcus opacus]|nr:long-chain fatty acid--CoA ligase [Rhodococcus opacus]